jgi:hypothetical protein
MIKKIACREVAKTWKTFTPDGCSKAPYFTQAVLSPIKSMAA